jgi:hypothetical protein
VNVAGGTIARSPSRPPPPRRRRRGASSARGITGGSTVMTAP